MDVRNVALALVLVSGPYAAWQGQGQSTGPAKPATPVTKPPAGPPPDPADSTHPSLPSPTPVKDLTRPEVKQARNEIICIGAVRRNHALITEKPVSLGELFQECGGLLPHAADCGHIFVHHRNDHSIEVTGSAFGLSDKDVAQGKTSDSYLKEMVKPGDVVYVPRLPLSAVVLGLLSPSSTHVFWGTSGVLRGDYSSNVVRSGDTMDPCVIERFLTKPASSRETWLSFMGQASGKEPETQRAKANNELAKEIAIPSGSVVLIPPKKGGSWAQKRGVKEGVKTHAFALPPLALPNTIAPDTKISDPSSIVVLGQVRTPGTVPFSKDNRLVDYIQKAGGLCSNADAKVFVCAPDQRPRLLKDSQDLKTLIEPGSTIIVPSTDLPPFAMFVGALISPSVTGVRLTPTDQFFETPTRPDAPPFETFEDAMERLEIAPNATLQGIIVIHGFATAEMSIQLMHDTAWKKAFVGAGDLVIIPAETDTKREGSSDSVPSYLSIEVESLQREITKIVAELTRG